MQVRRVDCTTATALLFPIKSHSLSFDGGSFLSSTRNSPRRADPLVPRVAAFDGHVVVASASSARYFGRRADETNALGDDGSRWKIWSVIEELETNGISSSSLYRPDDAIDDNLDDNGRVAVVVSAELIDRVI